MSNNHFIRPLHDDHGSKRTAIMHWWGRLGKPFLLGARGSRMARGHDLCGGRYVFGDYCTCHRNSIHGPSARHLRPRHQIGWQLLAGTDLPQQPQSPATVNPRISVSPCLSASVSSKQDESDFQRLGNPSLFYPVGLCSSSQQPHISRYRAKNHPDCLSGQVGKPMRSPREVVPALPIGSDCAASFGSSCGRCRLGP